MPNSSPSPGCDRPPVPALAKPCFGIAYAVGLAWASITPRNAGETWRPTPSEIGSPKTWNELLCELAPGWRWVLTSDVNGDRVWVIFPPIDTFEPKPNSVACLEQRRNNAAGFTDAQRREARRSRFCYPTSTEGASSRTQDGAR